MQSSLRAYSNFSKSAAEECLPGEKKTKVKMFSFILIPIETLQLKLVKKQSR